MKKCPRCGREFEAEAELRFCPVDGVALRLGNTDEIVPHAIIGERYEIRRQLGEGGMGMVYLANDIRLDRLCALKVLRPDALSDAGAVSRFHREATNASRIQHPHVVTIYNFDETSEQLTYLAMEYIEGRSLGALLGEVGALSPRPAARIVWQIANALDAAHELHIVHRDLKPGNIMLTRYREWNDFVKVVDFGIAKAFGTTTGDGITAHGKWIGTTRGKWIGTPQYMSPEQWLPVDVDHRSDIFSLGLMTIHMLAGGFPTADGTGPTPAGQRLIDALPPNDWPAGLTQVLLRCIAVEPDDRYQTAGDFAFALVDVVDGWIPRDRAREPWEARVRPGASAAATIEPAAHDDATVAFPGAAPPVHPDRPGGRSRRLWAWLAAPVVIGAGILSLNGVLGGNGPADSAGIDPAPPATLDSMNVASSSSPVPEDPDSAVANSDPPVSSGPPVTGTTATPAAPTAAAPSADVSLARLQALLDLMDPDPDSTRAAVGLATTLLAEPQPDSARIEISYRLVEGYLLLGDEAAACRTLRDIAPMTQRTGLLARSVDALLQRHCQSAGGSAD